MNSTGEVLPGNATVTRDWLGATYWGIAAGLMSHVVALFAVMLAVPRQEEGVRQIVAIPWPAYALLPSMLSAATLLVLLFVPLKQPNWRLRMILAAGITMALCSLLSIDLLRRDFAGKF